MDSKKHTTKNHRFTHSIKSKISLLSITLILIAVIINSLFIVNASKSTITTNTEKNMLDLVNSYNQNVANTLDKITESAQFMMQSEQLRNYINSGGTKNISEAQNFISMFLNMNEDTEEINLVDTDGNIILSSNDKNIGQNISAESYFTDMVSSNESTQSNVFQSETTGNFNITFAIPIRGGEPKDGEMQSTDEENPSNEGQNTNPPDMEFSGAITIVKRVSALNDTLSDISVSNSKSSYAYLLDSTGTIIYHPDEEKIGTKIENNAVNKIVNDVQTENINKSDIISYTYNGVKKIASFSINESNHWILVISAQESEILSSLNDITNLSIMVSIIMILILTIFAYFFADTIAKPIRKITAIINHIAELDFTTDSSSEKLEKKKDETGEMSRAIHKMRDVLHGMIVQIGDTSNNMQNTANSLNNITHLVTEHASDNSATAEELSASMEETAATTDVISTHIEQVGYSTKEITTKASEGRKISNTLIDRANQLKISTENATHKTKEIFIEVKEQTDLAIEQSKAVEKINVLTKTIKDIADQTSLLSLNASIEAARAGEAGRGFSVVASEISALADQSTNTVSNINEIVLEVNQAVSNMTKSLEQTLDFLEQNVLVDYNNFISVSDQYNSDAIIMNNTMNTINDKIESTSEAMKSITTSISEINSMIGEASTGVSDVAEKNSNIVEMTTKTYNMVIENTEQANKLKEIVNKFKL